MRLPRLSFNTNQATSFATNSSLKKYLETNYPSEERVVPAKDNFVGEPMKKKIGAYGISLNSYANASLWDGQPKYQTAYGWGH